jgi:hypothetical protein
MSKILFNLFDRCLFTLTFIVGVQLPEFMQQYLQRASGHLDEAQHQLAKFSEIADDHFDSDIIVMLQQYKMNAEQSIVHTGRAIEQLLNRVEYLDEHVKFLQQTEYIERLYNFFIHLDISIAQATLHQYQLAIPLTLSAISTGLFVAIMPVLFNSLFLSFIKLCLKPKKANNC